MAQQRRCEEEAGVFYSRLLAVAVDFVGREKGVGDLWKGRDVKIGPSLTELRNLASTALNLTGLEVQTRDNVCIYFVMSEIVRYLKEAGVSELDQQDFKRMLTFLEARDP